MEVRHEGKIIINRYHIGIYGYSRGLAPSPIPRTGLAIDTYPISAITINGSATDGFPSCLSTYSFGKRRGQPIIHNSYQVNNFQTNPHD